MKYNIHWPNYYTIVIWTPSTYSPCHPCTSLAMSPPSSRPRRRKVDQLGSASEWQDPKDACEPSWGDGSRITLVNRRNTFSQSSESLGIPQDSALHNSLVYSSGVDNTTTLCRHLVENKYWVWVSKKYCKWRIKMSRPLARPRRRKVDRRGSASEWRGPRGGCGLSSGGGSRITIWRRGESNQYLERVSAEIL